MAVCEGLFIAFKLNERENAFVKSCKIFSLSSAQIKERSFIRQLIRSNERTQSPFTATQWYKFAVLWMNGMQNLQAS